MFWVIYLFSAILLSYLLANSSKKYQFQLFFLVLITLITPAKVEISGLDYSPSLFTFIFNITLEQNFSVRVLRPLALSLPLAVFFLVIFSFFRRKFF
tara:strand:+ start:40965 stop:41255 length:291 start_codon:yes stop_codon:yes gene_type:complete